jgi:2-epi-5-epi-valiolone synthase
MTWHIKTSLPVEFKIIKVHDAFESLEAAVSLGQRTIIVIDQTVYDLYAESLPQTAQILAIPSSEDLKDWNTAQRILSFFQDIQVQRREAIVAIGGGVLLDIVGFCCSIYRRGVPYVRVPTTLLAIVDASVGAKTSINHFGFRNRIGSFYPPKLTLIDKSFVKTQDHREISNGMAEILKLAIVLDRQLFEMIETSPQELIRSKFQNNILADTIIDRSIAGMTQQLNDNLWETVLQRAVDFGHSFSPMVEMKNVPELLHGEAVILDCLLSSCISNNRGYLSNSDLSRIFSVVKSVGLPTEHSDFYDADLLWKGLQDVVNHRNGNQYLPVPTAIGSCEIINDLQRRELDLACEKMRSLQ